MYPRTSIFRLASKALSWYRREAKVLLSYSEPWLVFLLYLLRMSYHLNCHQLKIIGRRLKFTAKPNRHWWERHRSTPIFFQICALSKLPPIFHISHAISHNS